MGCTHSASGAAPDLRARVDKLEVLFFDCDDTLYQNGWKTAELLKDSIDRYTAQELGITEEGYAYELYKEHGTALRGLIHREHLPESRIEHFLEKVHDISLDDIGPNPALRRVILALGHKRRFVFTASIREHAERCLERLGIADLFEGIVDCRSVGLVTKHSPLAFLAAMEAAQVVDPEVCMIFDDSVSNITTARKTGWVTCSVGRERGTDAPLDCPFADFAVDRLEELPRAIPQLFRGSPRQSILVPSVLTRRSSAAASGSVRSGSLRTGSAAQLSLGLVADEDDEAFAPAPAGSKRGRRAVFVLGGPGCGKGTNCARLAQERGFVHLSAGDLLRAELERDGGSSELADTIRTAIASGSLVPSEVTMQLLIDAMQRAGDSGVFLIDGCPRDEDNLFAWMRLVQSEGHAELIGVLFFQLDEEAMLARILSRAEAAGESAQRADDNAATAKRRFATFRESTVPVVDSQRKDGLVWDVDAGGSKEEVYKGTVQAVDEMVADDEE